MKFKRIVFLSVLIASFITIPAQAKTSTPSSNVLTALNSMSPEERVGQLFLVTFTGTEVSADSQISNLIAHYHVGGVTLLATNDNFSAPGTLTQTHTLSEGLQSLNWDSSVTTTTDPVTGQLSKQTTYVPLFEGIEQEGNGYRPDQTLYRFW